MDRGDIYHVDLNPLAGLEQAGAGFVIIVTQRAFNRLGTPLVCPITRGGNFARHAGFSVSLSGAGTNTQGVILCNQPRVLDIQARKGRFVEKAPPVMVDEMIARVMTLSRTAVYPLCAAADVTCVWYAGPLALRC